jgi:hypothetical protein
MDEVDSDIVFLFEVFGYVLGAINGPVLPARTTETNLQMRKTALHEPLHVVIHQLIHTLQEREDLPVFLQEINHRLIQARQAFVLLVLTGVMGTPAIEHIPAAVPTLVSRYATLEGEGIDRNGKQPLPVPPLKGGGKTEVVQ